MKDVLESDHKEFPLAHITARSNFVEDDCLRGNVSSQKLSILPPPPLLIRPTPITQSRESLVLNTEAKFWNQGDQMFNAVLPSS